MRKTQRSTKQDSRSRRTRTTSDAREIIDKTIVGDNAELRELIEEATVTPSLLRRFMMPENGQGLLRKNWPTLPVPNSQSFHNLKMRTTKGIR